jgi:hypothetical protein
MSVRDPVTVLLPTVEWTSACEQVAKQLRPDDELFVICDSPDDSVASHSPPDGVEITVAGEPEGCAAKANAIAYGMERATNDRFVWSDADYERDGDWLDRLVGAGEEHGPAAVLPMFSGNGWWRLFEPVFVLILALRTGFLWDDADGGYPWGGGVTFAREELDVPVERFAGELRQCISDDNVLHEHVGDAYMLQEPPAMVHVEGDFRDTARRLIRWMRADHVRHDVSGRLVGSLFLITFAATFPFLVAPLVTVAAGLGYRKLGYSRWTFLLAYHGLFLMPFVFGAGILVDEFTWGSRRYRVNDLYDVEVLESEPAQVL